MRSRSDSESPQSDSSDLMVYDPSNDESQAEISFQPSSFLPGSVYSSPEWNAYLYSQQHKAISPFPMQQVPSQSSVSSISSSWETFSNHSFPQNMLQIPPEVAYKTQASMGPGVFFEQPMNSNGWYDDSSIQISTQSTPNHELSPSQKEERVPCPEGCQESMKRKYDVPRHIEEQHRCPYKSCADIKFTKEDRKQHLNDHPIGWECGVCKAGGLAKKPFTRLDKFKAHQRSEHGMKSDSGLFQCKKKPCFNGENGLKCGGLFFTSTDELFFHHRNAHMDPEATLVTEQITRSLIENSNSANIGKHPLAYAPESTAKRFKPYKADHTSSSISGEIHQQPSNHSISQNMLPVERDIPQGNSSVSPQKALNSSAGPVIEEALSFPLFKLPSLVKLGTFDYLTQRLQTFHISTLFDKEKDAILLRGPCPPEKMEKAKESLANLIAKIEVNDNYETDQYDLCEVPFSGYYARSNYQRHESQHPFQITSIQPTEDAHTVKTWKMLLPELPGILKDLPVGESYSVSLVRQMNENGTPTPTMRFCTSGGQSELVRKKIKNKVYLFLDQHGRPQIEVHFLTGSMVQLAKDYSSGSLSNDVRPFPHHRRFWSTPGMGASIGMSTCPHQSASSGGHITVNSQPYMLSVGHFIYPELESEKCACTGQTNKLSSPSIWDLKDLRRRTNQKVDELKMLIRDDLPAVASLEDVITGVTEGADVDELRLYQRIQEEQRKSDASFELGSLSHTCKRYSVRETRSHRWVNDDGKPILHRMDWSITDVLPKRQGYNYHRYMRKPQLDLDDFRNETIHKFGAGPPCEHIADFRGGESVYYLGQASCFREGQINPLPVLVKRNGRITHEWGIIVNGDEKKDASHFRGDSGAWIVDKERNMLLGMLFAWDQELLLFTPIQDIFDDIHETMSLDPDAVIDLHRRDLDYGGQLITLSCKHKDVPEDVISVERQALQPVPLHETLPKLTLLQPIEEEDLAISDKSTLNPLPPPTGDTQLPLPALSPPSPTPSLAHSESSSPGTPVSPQPATPSQPIPVNLPAVAMESKRPTIELLCLPQDTVVGPPKRSKTDRPWLFNQRKYFGDTFMPNRASLQARSNLKAVQTW